jgi:hypothetical protein
MNTKTPEQIEAARQAHAQNPAVILKRKRALENYIVSEGQVPNPDPTDYKKPAVTPEEAKEISKTLKKNQAN